MWKRCKKIQSRCERKTFMTPMLEDVKAAAIALSPEDRCELMNFLEGCTVEDLHAILGAWVIESERRFMQIQSGAIDGVSLDNVFAQRKNV
jgi:hypothetical protein